MQSGDTSELDIKEWQRKYSEMAAELEFTRSILNFYETLIDDLPVPVFAKSESGSISLLNQAYEKFFGVQRDEVLGEKPTECLNPEQREQIRRDEQEGVSGRERHYEVSLQTPYGIRDVIYWTKGIHISSLGSGRQVGVIVDITDKKRLQQELAHKISALKNAQEELERLSRTDPLTGLANRRPFDERLEENLSLADRHEHAVCVIMADLDFFKQVNDRFGHDQGDAVLRSCADILRSKTRKEDLAARFGGEEFVILLPSTTCKDAISLANRLRKAVSEIIVLPDLSRVTISMGVAQYKRGESGEELLKRADEALYMAKKTGRNRVCAAD